MSKKTEIFLRIVILLMDFGGAALVLWYSSLWGPINAGEYIIALIFVFLGIYSLMDF